MKPQTLSLRELIQLLTAPLRELFDEELPKGVNWFHVTGSLCLFFIGLQMVTGVLMAFYYTPSPESAWESVRYVNQHVLFGDIIHGLHHWGSTGFVLMIFIHLIRVYTFAAYKGARRWTWLVGVALLFVVLGFGFTGYLLPWDMKAYFGTKVGTSFVGFTPLVGPWLKRLLLGGHEITELTLPRFYAIHTFILPAALIALAAIHLFLIRLYGITPPWKRDDEAVEYTKRFFPDQALRDSTMMLVAMIVMLALAITFGGNLEEKADPFSTTYAPHPEWYFLGLQQLVRYFDGPLQVVGSFYIPMGFLALLAALPFIDRNPERRLSRRPVALTLMFLFVVAAVGLTIEGYRSLEKERRELAKVAAEIQSEQAESSADPDAGSDTEAREPGEGETGSPLKSIFSNTAQIRAGERLYQRLQCAECHVGEDVGTGLNIPPSLEYAGDRFKPQWMMGYMHEVPPRRYIRDDRRPVERMPDYKLTEDELTQITAYLMTKTQPERFENVPELAPSSPASIERGRELYETVGCRVCHILEGDGIGRGPDLDGMGSRLKQDFTYLMLKNPQSLVPETSMEESFLSDEELEDLTHYLQSLK